MMSVERYDVVDVPSLNPYLSDALSVRKGEDIPCKNIVSVMTGKATKPGIGASCKERVHK